MPKLHTPSTDEVREAYQSTGDGLDFKHRFLERGEEFDAWLAARDEELLAPVRQRAERAENTLAKITAGGVRHIHHCHYGFLPSARCICGVMPLKLWNARPATS